MIPFGDLVGPGHVFDYEETEANNISTQGRKAKVWFRKHSIPLKITSNLKNHCIGIVSATE